MIEETTTASARRQRVVEAGMGVFLRYGYARTPLSEIGADALLDDFAALPAALARLER